MGKNSKIEWCDHTGNLWWGCAKEHEGCRGCYAEAWANRFEPGLWGKKAGRKRIKGGFGKLRHWDRIAKAEGRFHKVFVGSMMDIFEESKPLSNADAGWKTTGELREDLFRAISADAYPNLIFLFLTKRPQNITKMIPDDWSHGMRNVWFGTSVSSVKTLRYADALRNSVKFNNTFLSIEPQIGPIMLDDINLKGIDWVIQGGESGPKKRPFEIEWAYEMKRICELYGVPYFFKQIDKVQPIPEDLMIREFPDF